MSRIDETIFTYPDPSMDSYFEDADDDAVTVFGFKDMAGLKRVLKEKTRLTEAEINDAAIKTFRSKPRGDLKAGDRSEAVDFLYEF